jgi:hypothetical protein
MLPIRNRTRSVRLEVATAALVWLLAASWPAQAQMLDALRYAPDITVDLGGTLVPGGTLATDDLAGGVTAVTLPGLPPEARIAAAHRLPNGDLLLAFESTISLAGAGIVEPRDIVRLTEMTSAYSVEVHGADVGIPTNAAIDALAVTGDGTILLSLDIDVGGFDDADVIKIVGTNLQLFLDLNAIGIDPALDLDALDIEDSGGNTVLYVSFDGSGSVDAVAFDDEDVLAYNLTTQTWSLAYDGSAAAAHWPAAADLIGVDVALVATPTASPSATPIATATSTTTVTATGGETPTTTSTSVATATATHTSLTTGTATETATRMPTSPVVTGTPTETSSASPTRVHTQTATATSTVSETTTAATATSTATITAGIPCAGDCNGSGEVTIDELITLVNIALGSAPVSACPAGDINNDGMISIDEIVTAVGNALNGCP